MQKFQVGRMGSVFGVVRDTCAKETRLLFSDEQDEKDEKDHGRKV